jgi:SAM-dependent methyltransferase
MERSVGVSRMERPVGVSRMGRPVGVSRMGRPVGVSRMGRSAGGPAGFRLERRPVRAGAAALGRAGVVGPLHRPRPYAGGVGYDDLRAARYDEGHRHAFALAESTAGALAGLHARAAARDGRAGRVLELGVGTGRLALPLAARGLEVWGVDDSPAMLERLRAKPGGDAVRLVAGDFADVGGLVEGRFSLVFVAYNTLFELPTQDAQVRCVAGVAQVLTPGGLFAVEALAPDVTRLDQTVAATALDPGRLVLQATRHDPATQVVTGHDVTVTAAGVELSPWTIRYATAAEIDLMARLAGLRLLDRWGSWHGEPFAAASPVHVSVYGHADRA